MKRFLAAFAVLFLVVCVMGTVDVAAESGGSPDSKPVADEMIGSSGITWMPKVNYKRLVLTVSRPDGTVYQKTFESGSGAYLDLSGIYGDNACDGSYTYELRVIPAAGQEIRKSMETAGLEKKEIPVQKPLTQTGHFLVQGGALVTNTAPEGLDRTHDVLHYDDVIITGSLCVGFDCQDGESFGFDTIILKENNLRIYFNDTSYTASYPTNNWRITVNDSTNGGASYFSVDDVDDGVSIFKIEAGAPANSLYVEDYGRVGLGTSTPVVELHIKDSDTPTVRLEQDSSGGWTAQTWDVAGNESNFFVRDATNGSKLPFRIQPSTPSSTLCLKSDGKVGIGTWSPDYKVVVETTGENCAIVARRTSGVTNFMNATASYGNFGTVNNFPAQIMVNSSYVMRFNTNSTLTMSDGGSYNGTWNPASSRELKENIKDLTTDEAVAALTGLSPVKYNYKAHNDEPRVGFIAEDVPELVAMNGRKTLGTVDITAVLTKVVQEQQKSIKEQQESIKEQQKIISDLNKRIADLEKKSK
jgi:hypothetical protein